MEEFRGPDDKAGNGYYQGGLGYGRTPLMVMSRTHHFMETQKDDLPVIRQLVQGFDRPGKMFIINDINGNTQDMDSFYAGCHSVLSLMMVPTAARPYIAAVSARSTRFPR